MILFILRVLAFVFGFFELLGVLWASGLAKSSFELFLWSAPAISLLIGSLTPNSMCSNYILGIVVLGISLFALFYAGQLLYGNWINPGIDSENDFLRVMFIMFVIYRFGLGILRKVKGIEEE
ncbi:MAG: hypothetical protein AB2799_09300 [Candidatus Thiodiazotropha sp.]